MGLARRQARAAATEAQVHPACPGGRTRGVTCHRFDIRPTLTCLLFAAGPAAAQSPESGFEKHWILALVAVLLTLVGVFLSFVVTMARNQRLRRHLRHDRRRVMRELRSICRHIEQIRQTLQEAGLDDHFAGRQSAQNPDQSQLYREQMTALQKQLERLRHASQHFSAHPKAFPNARNLQHFIVKADHYLAEIGEEFEQHWPSISSANEGVDLESLHHLRHFTAADRKNFQGHFIAPMKRLIRILRSDSRSGRSHYRH